jgi:hypothetical protein
LSAATAKGNGRREGRATTAAKRHESLLSVNGIGGILSFTGLSRQELLSFKYMRFETFGAHGPPSGDIHEVEHRIAFRERLGGPLRPNHLLSTELGIDEAKPILEQLRVVHKISLYTPEVPLGREAAAPAEYRIEIMDSVAPNSPASEEYVQHVFSALREARVPVQRADPHPDEED